MGPPQGQRRGPGGGGPFGGVGIPVEKSQNFLPSAKRLLGRLRPERIALSVVITLGVINEMASEYRALRASILRLWADRCGPKSTDMQDMICFNEAIDQALCESIGHFSGEVDRARNLLLGVLGHDMRTLL